MSRWNPYPHAPDYLVSKSGNIKSSKTGKVLKPQKYKNYRLKVFLSVNGKKVPKYIHRMVAETYIPNPLSLPEVNHIDGNRYNNRLDNLAWISEDDNKTHATEEGLHGNPCGRKAKTLKGRVIVLAPCGKRVYTLYGKQQIEQTGFNYNAVNRVVNGKQKTHKGFRFIRKTAK